MHAREFFEELSGKKLTSTRSRAIGGPETLRHRLLGRPRDLEKFSLFFLRSDGKKPSEMETAQSKSPKLYRGAIGPKARSTRSRVIGWPETLRHRLLGRPRDLEKFSLFFSIGPVLFDHNQRDALSLSSFRYLSAARPTWQVQFSDNQSPIHNLSPVRLWAALSSLRISLQPSQNDHKASKGGRSSTSS